MIGNVWVHVCWTNSGHCDPLLINKTQFVIVPDRVYCQFDEKYYNPRCIVILSTQMQCLLLTSQ